MEKSFCAKPLSVSKHGLVETVLIIESTQGSQGTLCVILLTGVSVRKYQFFVEQKRFSCKHKEMLTRLTVLKIKFESLFMANLAKLMNDQSNCCNVLLQGCCDVPD